jgi:predicted ArsR family transcriptional regulator
MPQPVDIPLEPLTAAAYFAPRAVELARAGLGVIAIAETLATTAETIREALRSVKANGDVGAVGQSGRMPTWWSGKRGSEGKKQPKYIEHATEIARLYEQDDQSFELIGAKLQMSPTTATKSYDDLLASSFRVPHLKAGECSVMSPEA